jgi:hypothetical protein
MIRFVCTCGRELEAANRHAGAEGRCPRCGTIMLIPVSSSGAPPSFLVRGEGLQPIAPESVEVAWPKPSPERPLAPFLPRNGKAKASLALGVVALACMGLVQIGLSSSILLFALAFLITLSAGLAGEILGLLALRAIWRGKAAGGIAPALFGVVMSVGSILFTMFFVGSSRERSFREEAGGNLQRLAIAMWEHHDTQGRMPAATIRSRQGEPLLSWRVAILPYLGEEALYRRFHLEEPWNSPHNIRLLPRMPAVYALPGRQKPEEGQTCFQVFVGPQTLFRDSRAGPRPEMFGTWYILIAEAAEPVPWTAPEDLPYHADLPLPRLGGHDGEEFQAVTFSAGRETFPRAGREREIRRAITGLIPGD